jgi:tape measure domain-containing protein
MTDYTIRLVLEGRDAGATAVLTSVGSGLSNIGQVTAGILGANAIQAIGQQIMSMGQAGLESYRYYERLDLSLQSLSARELRNRDSTLSMAQAFQQSSGRASELLNWVEQLAIKSPFDQQGVASAFQMQLAYGFASDAAQVLTRVMIDWASGSGRTTESMNRVSLALGQIYAQGRLSGQEVRQLTEAGISVDQILSKAFNKPVAEIVRMRTEGLIPANEAIQAIVDSLDKDFGGAAQRQSGTMEGLINSMSDIKSIGLREFFTGTFEAIQPKLQEFVDKFQDPAVRASIKAWGDDFGQMASGMIANMETIVGKIGELVTWWNSLDGATQRLISSAGLFIAVGPTMVNIIGGLVTAGTTLAGILPSIAAGWSAWSAGMSLTTALGAAGIAPLAVTIGAVALAVGAVVGVWMAWNAEITQTNKQGVQAVNNQWVDFFNRQKEAGADASAMLEEYKKAQTAVNQQVANAGPILGLFIDKQGILKSGLTELNSALQGSATTYEQYVSSMVDAAVSAGALDASQVQLQGDYINNANVMNFLTGQLGLVTQAQFQAGQAAVDTAEKYANLNDTGMLSNLETGKGRVDGLSTSLNLAKQEAAALAEEQEKLEKTARDAAFAQYDLTASLNGAGLAATNKVMLDQYRQTLEKLELPPDVITKNLNAMGLEMGVIDQRSINLSNGISLMNQALLNGTIPIGSAREAWAMYYNTVQTGNPNFDAVLAKFGVMPSQVDPAAASTNSMTGSLNTLNTQAGTTQTGITNMATTTQTKMTDLSTKTFPDASKKITDDLAKVHKEAGDVGSTIGDIQEAANNLYNWALTHTIVINVQVNQSGSIPSGVSGTSPQGYAFGGDVLAGIPTIVGEKGREVFIPPVNGRILSSRDVDRMMTEGGGRSEGKTMNFYIYDASDPMGVAEEIRRMEFFYA